MMYPLVLDLAADKIPIAVTCRVLGFSKQAFYKWRAKPVCDRDYDDAHLINAAVDVHHDDPEFGYRFITDELCCRRTCSTGAAGAAEPSYAWRSCPGSRAPTTAADAKTPSAGSPPSSSRHRSTPLTRPDPPTRDGSTRVWAAPLPPDAIRSSGSSSRWMSVFLGRSEQGVRLRLLKREVLPALRAATPVAT
jgi:hypothetical protein